MSEPMSEERLSTLRLRVAWYGSGCPDVDRSYLSHDASDDLQEAIDEIDRLRAENAKLRERECYGDFSACECAYHSASEVEPMGLEEHG